MPHTRAAERISLIEKATQLSTALASVLADIGPNSYGAVISPSSDKGSYERIQELESGLHDKLQTVSEYRNIALSPSTRLTDDLLRAIFQLAGTPATKADDPLMFPYPAQDTSISKITAVCRRWRFLALDTATLWSSVVLDTPQRLVGEPRKRHPVYDLLTTKVLRPRHAFSVQQAKDSLLDLEIILSDEPTLPDVISNFMTTCSQRTRSLKLHIRGSVNLSVARAAVDCIAAARRSLVHLKISMDYPGVNISLEIQDLFASVFDADMPCLEQAEVLSVLSPERWGRSKAFTTCKILKFSIFETGTAPLNHMTDLIFPWSNLCNLSLYFANCITDTPPHMERFLLPNLRRFTLHLHNCGFFLFPFYRFNLPRLAHLDINVGTRSVRDREETCVGIESAVSDLLKSSGSPVLQSLRAKHLSQTCLKLLLHTASTITTFHLDLGQDGAHSPWHGARESTYAALSYLESRHEEEPSSSNLPCPSLSCLELGLVGSLPSMKRLRQFAELRKAAGSPLRTIKFKDWTPPWALQTRADLEEWPSVTEALEVEAELAGVVEELVVGDWRFDKEGGCWMRIA